VDSDGYRRYAGSINQKLYQFRCVTIGRDRKVLIVVFSFLSFFSSPLNSSKMYRSDFERARVRFIRFRIPASVSFILPHLPRAARFMQIWETAARAKFSQIMRTFLLRQVHVYKKPTKTTSCRTRDIALSVSLSFGCEHLSFRSVSLFDPYLHPSLFYFDVNFEGLFPS